MTASLIRFRRKAMTTAATLNASSVARAQAVSHERQTGQTAHERGTDEGRAKIEDTARGTILEQPAELVRLLAARLPGTGQADVAPDRLERSAWQMRRSLGLAAQVMDGADSRTHDASLALMAHQRAQQGSLDRLAAGRAGLASSGFNPTPPAASDWALFDLLFGTIGDTKANLVDPYTEITEMMTRFFGDISDLMGKLSGCIKEGKDSSHLSIDGEAIAKACEGVINAWGGVQGLRSKDKWLTFDFDKATADKWAKELGNAIEIINNGDGTYSMRPNLTELTAMMNSTPADNPWEPNVSAYQAWNAGFSGQKDAIQNKVQTLVEKYSRMNSTFDNMVKILSSTMQAMLETEKAYLQI